MRLFGANFLLQELPSEIRYRPVTLVTHDDVLTRAILYWKDGVTPRVGVHVMHPRTDQSHNYNIVAMANAGYAVLGRAGRWVNNDVDTVHERLMPDVADGVRFLREEVGCEQVLLLGNSGGGSLASMYQSQARTHPPGRLTDTAAGDLFDLNGFDLPPADGIVIIAGHLGEGEVMRNCIDPSVVDEHDPVAADPAVNMYDSRNGFREPPEPSRYADDFVTAYRAAQLARVRRLDGVARQWIADGRAAAGGHMVIYRTAADLTYTDLSLDPDDRIVSSYFTQRPDLENWGAFGFARYLTPRAWLSTWSALSSRAETIPSLQRIPDPLLVVHYAGDQGFRLSAVQAMFEAAASDDKELKIIGGADHYGRVILPDGGLGGQTTEGTDTIVEWAKARFKP
jgi:pimeloyl-ACP methyl ester carboxylesterase